MLAIRLNGKMIDEVDDRGRTIESETLLILSMAEDHQVEFTLPHVEGHEYWKMEIDTASPGIPSQTPAGRYSAFAARPLDGDPRTEAFSAQAPVAIPAEEMAHRRGGN